MSFGKMQPISGSSSCLHGLQADSDDTDQPSSRRVVKEEEHQGRPKKKIGRPIAYVGDINSPHLTPAERRRIKRRITNRESARRIRQKMAQNEERMHSLIKELREQNGDLMARITLAEQERVFMLAQVAAASSKCHCDAKGALAGAGQQVADGVDQPLHAHSGAISQDTGSPQAADPFAIAPLRFTDPLTGRGGLHATASDPIPPPDALLRHHSSVGSAAAGHLASLAASALAHRVVININTPAGPVPVLQGSAAAAAASGRMPCAQKESSVDLDWLLRQASQDLLSIGELIGASS